MTISLRVRVMSCTLKSEPHRRPRHDASPGSGLHVAGTADEIGPQTLDT
jgi:hypothetical protein